MSFRSAWPTKHKIVEAMRLREDRRELTGPVKIHDTYLRGELPGGKASRGPQNTVPLIAALQTTPNGRSIAAYPRQHRHTEEEFAVFAANFIAPSATVVSDRVWCFRATAIVGPEYERQINSGSPPSVTQPRFKAINTLLGNFKIAIIGSYHAFGFAKYAHRYLAEPQYQANRLFDMVIILSGVLCALLVAPPLD